MLPKPPPPPLPWAEGPASAIAPPGPAVAGAPDRLDGVRRAGAGGARPSLAGARGAGPRAAAEPTEAAPR
eukprot:7650233-Lingulodinium_polyedra.AAC.1